MYMFLIEQDMRLILYCLTTPITSVISARLAFNCSVRVTYLNSQKNNGHGPTLKAAVLSAISTNVGVFHYVPSIVFFQKVSSSSASKWKGYEKTLCVKSN